MDLSPNDIRNYEYGTQMRGYDKDEVDSFKEQVASALETAKQENLKLSMEVDSLKTQLAGLKQFEDTIKSAAIDARRNADSTIAAAKQEAEEMLSKAKAEAEGALASRTQQVTEIEEQITKLGLTKRSYLTKIRNLIQSHLELIEEVAESEGAAGQMEDQLEVTDSTEVRRRRRETVATRPRAAGAIITEEANAPGRPIAHDGDDASDDEAAEQLRDVLNGEQAEAEQAPPEPPKPSETPGIDPELAAALENYQKRTTENQANERAAEAPINPVVGEVVETTARAEDIPPGFIPENSDVVKESTDRVQVAGMDHNTINVDEPIDAPAKKPIGDIAHELDEVAAKFEEEMAKAEQQS